MDVTRGANTEVCSNFNPFIILTSSFIDKLIFMKR